MISLVIFGASGDLSKRKLFPALYHLDKAGELAQELQIVGFSRTNYSRDSFIDHLKKDHTYEEIDFFQRVEYCHGEYTNVEDLKRLHNQISSNLRLFYLAVPPNLIRPIIETLAKASAITEKTRIIFEKPFGNNYDSAYELENFLHLHLQEHQIWRIDHYLGKETVQNILAFRFGNTLFESLWNNRYIESIEINISEDLTIEKRAGHFDQTGLLRDIIQNHALQLLAQITMGPPNAFSSRLIRQEKIKLLEALVPPTPNDILRGQYEGYLQEEGVAPHSQTETFVALKFTIQNWIFAGIPIYVRAGKALANKATEVAITFKKVVHRFFETPVSSNVLFFRIQPQEGLHLVVNSKIPGPQFDVTPVIMNFAYSDSFVRRQLDAYERLLLDALHGDSSLFISSEEVLASWRFIDPILHHWEKDNPPLYHYKKGQYGPDEMYNWIRKDGLEWNINLCPLKL